MENFFTHLGEVSGEISKNVIMCGDPVRAEIMTKRFLGDAHLVSTTRGNKVFTGMYKGHKITIMASFMGAPSMGIYSYELYKFFGVENIIRLGTAGSMDASVKLGDIVVCEECQTDSNYMDMHANGKDQILFPSKDLKDKVLSTAKDISCPVKVGKFYCTDTFYADDKKNKYIMSTSSLAVEMENGSLFCNANLFGKKALSICTISDEIYSGGKLSNNDREYLTDKMFYLALEMFAKFDKNL